MKKSILITGSTDGIGKLAAIQLAKEGHSIYVHGRNATKLKDVIFEIKSVSNNSNIHGFVADFSDLTAVKEMAAQVNKDVLKLDVLINNAGVFMNPNDKTKDGFEIRFAVNYLAPYVLTNELLPLLKKEPKSRVINLSSAAQAPVSLEALSGNQKISTQEAYAQSKLALTMWSFDLAKSEPNVNIIAVNPGSLLNTNMVKEAYGKHWSSAEKGSNILSKLAVSEEFNDDSGKYFDNDKGEDIGSFGDAHINAYDKTLTENLLNKTVSLIN